MKRVLVLLVLTAWLAPPSAAGAAAAPDWPQWRFDANRSGATDQPGPPEPGLLWRLSLEYPDPAYDHQYRMCADASYAPVAAEGLVFLPSNVADQVMACDLHSGALRWRCLTEGPVRFAPVYREGKLYFGCDDGYLHCVSAGDGKPLWKVRGVPEGLPDSRMLVNGRLTSRWPVRGAPVEQQGVIYFGAGIWPEEGVYVSAVRAETGQLLWRSDGMSYIKQGMSDHGRPYDLSLPPQGYLALIDGRLAVPSGRSLAAWFDPQTGRMEPYTCFYVKDNPPRGTWCLSGIGCYSVQGGNWFATRPGAVPALPTGLKTAGSALNWSRQTPENERYVMAHRPFLRTDCYRLHNENLYTEPVLTATTMYASEFADETKYLVPRGQTRVAFPQYDRIVARDLTRPQWTAVAMRRPAGGDARVLKLEFPLVWQLASPLRVLLKAGDRLYAGGKDTIAAVAIPPRGGEPHVAWRASITGTPVNALVASGKLVVVTELGDVYCFGDGPRDPHAETGAAAQAKGPYRSPPEGYACLFGWGDGSRAMTLAAEGQHQVIVFEPDAAKAAEARSALVAAGLYGRPVQLVEARLDKLRLPPYWASLVVADAPDSVGSAEAVFSAALDLVRPYGGELRLANGRKHVDLLQRLLAGRNGFAMTLDGQGITVRRPSPPAGAGDWTHEAGGAANGFAGSEQLVKWPLGLLWYSGGIDRYFTPAEHFQHQRQPYPLVAGGRMFLVTGQDLHAIDIYTGNYLWKAEMPLTPWVRTRFFDSRIYGRPTERNYVAAPDCVYVVTGEKILAYDAATGRQVKTFGVPPRLADEARKATPPVREENYMGYRATIQAAPTWTEVRLWNDLLLAMLGNTLVALDRHTGDLRWARPSTRQTTTYALSVEMLFGLDCDVPPLGGGGNAAGQSGLLFALDPREGRVRWQKQIAYAPVPGHEIYSPRLWLVPILPELAYNAKHGLLVMTINRTNVEVFHAGDGSLAWSKSNPVRGNLQGIYSPVVTEDYLVLSQYKGCYGFLLEITTGRELGKNTGIPRPRTCARIISNNNLLVCRDAATELYDIPANRMIGLNSVRSGCTTSFIPAGGVLTAPMLGHGCVCNYPMFASLALYHWPEIDQYRPACVTSSWGNRLDALAAQGVLPRRASAPVEPFPSIAGEKVDIQKFHLVNATMEHAGWGFRLASKDQAAGYAIRPCDEPLEKVVFRFRVRRAGAAGRHGNAFFVCGPNDKPEDWIQCQLYYGGRRAMAITGKGVVQVQAKLALPPRDTFAVTVRIDCAARTVAFEADSAKLSSRITGPLGAITHYGCGGSNADNFFTPIEVAGGSAP